MKRLQVLKDRKWNWVFCCNPVKGIITTKDKAKALKPHDLEYFRNKFGNDTFRLSN